MDDLRLQLDLFGAPAPMPERRRKALIKDARKLLAEARKEWRRWKTGRVTHPELFALVACDGWCGGGRCEGCIATDYRAGELAAIESGAEFLKSVIADLEVVA